MWFCQNPNSQSQIYKILGFGGCSKSSKFALANKLIFAFFVKIWEVRFLKTKMFKKHCVFYTFEQNIEKHMILSIFQTHISFSRRPAYISAETNVFYATMWFLLEALASISMFKLRGEIHLGHPNVRNASVHWGVSQCSRWCNFPLSLMAKIFGFTCLMCEVPVFALHL